MPMQGEKQVEDPLCEVEFVCLKQSCQSHFETNGMVGLKHQDLHTQIGTR